MAAVVHLGRIGQQYMDRNIFENSFRVECKARVSAADVYDSLKEVLHENDIVEIARTDGFTWNIVVGSSTAAEILRDCGAIEIKKRHTKVVSVSYQVIEVRCHWLPSYIKDDFLKYLFADYGMVREIKRENTILSANLQRQNGIRVVVLETDELMKGRIPHMIRFEGNMTMLITMPGRAPLCLRCNSIGHLRRDCNFVTTRQHQGPPRKTYATAAASPEVDNRKTEEELGEKEVRQDEKKSDDDTVMEGEPAMAENDEENVEKSNSQWQTVEGKKTKERRDKEIQQGVRRSWVDSEGFDLDAASQGQLCIDEGEGDSVSIKRSKMEESTNPFSILEDNDID